MYELYHIPAPQRAVQAAKPDREGQARAIIGMVGATVCAAICLIGATVAASTQSDSRTRTERPALRIDAVLGDVRRPPACSTCIEEGKLDRRMAQAHCLRAAPRLPVRPGNPAG